MVTKYGDLCRQFVSSDGKVHHTVVLNESYMDTFALVSVDNSTKEGTLNIVYKENKANNEKDDDDNIQIKPNNLINSINQINQINPINPI